MENGGTLIAQLRAMKTFLSPEQLGPMLGIQPGSLAARRTRGQSPAFIKLGNRVRYDPNVVADWLASHTVTPPDHVAYAAPQSAAPMPLWLQATRAKSQTAGGQS